MLRHLPNRPPGAENPISATGCILIDDLGRRGNGGLVSHGLATKSEI